MKMSVMRIELPLEHEFTIARGSISKQLSVFVQLEHDGLIGLGEVTENSFYKHDFASIRESLRSAASVVSRYRDTAPGELWEDLRTAMRSDMFALCALDVAAHDLDAKRGNRRVWEGWGLEWTNIPQSSYTIGIDNVETMVTKLDEKPGWGFYKIKLGTPNDIEIVTELRRHSDATFRVDANCGWTVEETIRNAQKLADLGVEFIEQPLPNDAPEDHKREVYEKSILPVVADEDCQVASDVARCAESFHGVNVKLCKCGGLSPAFRMLNEAKALGMKTMVGCMVESSIGISGAAQLLPLLDYADLDGAVLLADEPAAGVSVEKGAVTIPDRTGTGAELDRQRLDPFILAEEEIMLS